MPQMVSKKLKKGMKEKKEPSVKLTKAPKMSMKKGKKHLASKKLAVQNDKFVKGVAHSAKPMKFGVRKAGPVMVASDCSGYGSEVIALDALGIDFKKLFSSDIDKKKRKLLTAVCTEAGVTVGKIHHDISTRDTQKLPRADLYLAGPPCQAFSGSGLNMGLADLQNRGVVIFHTVDYVVTKQPRCFLIESVENLAKRHLGHLEQSIAMLEKAGYQVKWEVMDTKQHGIPQSRPRVYICGVHTDNLYKEFCFPKPLDWDVTVDMGYLNMNTKGDDFHPSKQSATFRRNYSEAKQKAKHNGLDWSKELIIYDAEAGADRMYSTSKKVSPCLIKSRPRGYWVNVLSRSYTVVEMGKLQGIDKRYMEAMKKSGVTDR